MIDEIQVENLALIKNASLEPSSGLTVITGETGAGKTALLSACKLLMGERADKSTVRDGEKELTVSGRFYGLTSPSAEVDPDATDLDDELVAVRRVTADGRSRVSLNGSMASVGQLASTVAPSVDLCGQHEHQQLMKPATHGRMLDAWAGEPAAQALAAYQVAFAEANDAAAELERVLHAGAESSAKLDEARFVLKRIDEVSPQEGEYEELASNLAKAEHAESLAMSADGAYQALAGDGGALDGLNAAISALDSAARYDESLGACADSLREAGYIMEDIAAQARDYRDEVEFDPETLAQQQERMSALQGLLRAYGPRMEDVLAAREEAYDLMSLVDDAADRERAARKALDVAEKQLAKAAQSLAVVRTAAAPQFAEAVTAQMARLEMGSAQLVCQTDDLPREAWTRAGSQSVEFMFRPGEGMQVRPLVRIASGGEISRVMLAIKVVLGETDSVDTLVFDEVDAGVGGSTAVALAEVLADLAKTHQVLVVTHLAQVAVRGDAHYVVQKNVASEGGIPETTLTRLTDEGRPAEIARMLSGSVTETSLAHARELLVV